MGLDSFWADPDSKKEDGYEIQSSILFDPPLRLCGGIFSGNGQGSFRGKVYNPFIEAVCGTDYSLYEEAMPNAKVRKIALALEEFVEDYESDECLWPMYGVELDEARDLARMFRAYANAGSILCGWW